MAIIAIPVIEIISGDSSGSIIQLKMAPNTGIINFQTFNSDTLIPGRLSKINHKVNETADNILSHPNAK